MAAQQDSRNVQEALFELYNMLATRMPGDVTLNQIRVLHYIALSTTHRGRRITNKNICEALDLAPATVSRAILQFQKVGLVAEEQSEHDGRSRYIYIDEYRDKGEFDTKVAEIFRELSEKFDTTTH